MSSTAVMIGTLRVQLLFSPFLTSGLIHPFHLDESIPSYKGFW